MKLIGLMLVRNEDWILNLSARIALQWCDGLMIVNHASKDGTARIIDKLENEFPDRVRHDYLDEHDWNEMDFRQGMLESARRRFSPTHLALIDADEILTANLLPVIRGWVEMLKPGHVLELPMIATYDCFQNYRDDDSVWSHSMLSLAIAESPVLAWKPQLDGYQHHNRIPFGASLRSGKPIAWKEKGGVMHCQWCDVRRITAKHVHYRMMEHLRWPGRMTPAQLNEKYDNALKPGILKEIDPRWIDGFPQEFHEARFKIDQSEPSWYEWEIKALIEKHGLAAFEGLDLKGFGRVVECNRSQQSF